MKISFEPVQQQHLPLLEVWLQKPHWREWWDDPQTELGYIVNMIEGRDSTKPFIFSFDGVPVGYIQYWFIGPHQTKEWVKDNPWLMELPSDAVGVDLSIGEAQNLSKGFGSEVLRQFVDGLYGKGYETIVIDPDPLNFRAVRAYEKAGFRPVPHLLGRTEGVLIMQHERNI
ncbi:MAG: GNAT family N-acetyltransferase [Aestuariivirga sp.]